MNNPKWQRARYLRLNEGTLEDLAGHLMWVTGKPYRAATLRELMEGKKDRKGRVWVLPTNVYLEDQPLFAKMDHIELLGEFADDVPLVLFDDWLRQTGGERR